jgi:hypothetical protein
MVSSILRKKIENGMALRESLNPLTNYKLGITSQRLPPATKWNFVITFNFCTQSDKEKTHGLF